MRVLVREGACVGGFLCTYMYVCAGVLQRESKLERQRKCVRVRYMCGYASGCVCVRVCVRVLVRLWVRVCGCVYVCPCAWVRACVGAFVVHV